MGKKELKIRLHNLERRVHELFEMEEDQIDAEFAKKFPAIDQQKHTTAPLRSLVMVAIEENFPVNTRS